MKQFKSNAKNWRKCYHARTDPRDKFNIKILLYLGLIIILVITFFQYNKFINDQLEFENNKRLHILELLLDEALADAITLDDMLENRNKYQGLLFLAASIYRVDENNLDEILQISLNYDNSVTVEELFLTETKFNYHRYRIHSEKRSPDIITIIKN